MKNYFLIYKRKVSFKTEIDYILFILFTLYSFVDCLTGIAKEIGIPSPGVPYKMLVMGLIVLSVNDFFSVLFPFYFFSVISLSLLSFCFSSVTSFGDSFSMLLRICYCPFIYIYMKKRFIKIPNSSFLIKVICYINFFVIMFNQFLGVIGFGNKTYDGGGFGIKGFYYDGNALAVECFCLFCLFFALFKEKKISLLIVFSSILIGTKTAILSCFLYFVVFELLSTKGKTKLLILIFTSILIIAFIYIIKETTFLDYHIWKIKHMYEIFGGHILDVILSGRSLDLKNHYFLFNENFSLKQLFFGYGFRNDSKIIELDPFDTFFSYGLVFFLPLVSFYLGILFKNKKNREIFLFNFLYLFISITSGHVWYNTSSALFFVLINCYKDSLHEEYLLHN